MSDFHFFALWFIIVARIFIWPPEIVSFSFCIYIWDSPWWIQQVIIHLHKWHPFIFISVGDILVKHILTIVKDLWREGTARSFLFQTTQIKVQNCSNATRVGLHIFTTTPSADDALLPVDLVRPKTDIFQVWVCM